MIKTLYEDIVTEWANKYGFEHLLIHAIIHVESNHSTWATRFEPNWRYFYDVDKAGRFIKPPITYQTERVHQMTSWGLMQVMGSVAREHKFKDTLVKLCVPEFGVEYGVRHLDRLRRGQRSVEETIASYNAGSPRKLANGLYVNQVYVDKVFDAWKTLREQTNHLP